MPCTVPNGQFIIHLPMYVLKSDQYGKIYGPQKTKTIFAALYTASWQRLTPADFSELNMLYRNPIYVIYLITKEYMIL